MKSWMKYLEYFWLGISFSSMDDHIKNSKVFKCAVQAVLERLFDVAEKFGCSIQTNFGTRIRRMPLESKLNSSSYFKLWLVFYFQNLMIELTDGGYSIRGWPDRPLTRLLNDGKLVVGQKLCVYGAELVGSEQAVSLLEVHLRSFVVCGR